LTHKLNARWSRIFQQRTGQVDLPFNALFDNIAGQYPVTALKLSRSRKGEEFWHVRNGA
jgi:hypothetical protein